MANSIKTFTPKGTAINAEPRAGVKPASLGSFDPATGRVYQRPRLKLDEVQGRSVVVTNPKAAKPRLNQRTASIGAKAAGQRGRHADE